jgi:hypothetical protein
MCLLVYDASTDSSNLLPTSSTTLLPEQVMSTINDISTLGGTARANGQLGCNSM